MSHHASEVASQNTSLPAEFDQGGGPALRRVLSALAQRRGHLGTQAWSQPHMDPWKILEPSVCLQIRKDQGPGCTQQRATMSLLLPEGFSQ